MRFPTMLTAITLMFVAGGSTASGMPRSVNLGHLADVIYTRDVWMHTIDIARAVERPLDVTEPVNRRIVADIVAEWTRHHRRPINLLLTGPAGGHYGSPEPADDAPIEQEAIEFCRILSGRSTGEGLMAIRVIF